MSDVRTVFMRAARAYLAAFVVFLAAGGLLWQSSLSFNNVVTPAAALLVGFFATVGWITQWANAQYWARKQHTMTLVTQIRTSELWNRHRINIFSELGQGKLDQDTFYRWQAEWKSETKHYNAKKNPPETHPLDSIIQMANILEYVCIAINQGDLDEKLIYETIGSHIQAHYERYGVNLEFFLNPKKLNPAGQIERNQFIGLYYYAHKWTINEELLAIPHDFPSLSTGVPALSRDQRRIDLEKRLEDLNKRVSLHLRV